MIRYSAYLLPFVCQCVWASPFVWPPAVELSASVCIFAAGSSPSAALPAAERSPAAAERTRNAAEVNHIDRSLSKRYAFLYRDFISVCRGDLNVHTSAETK